MPFQKTASMMNVFLSRRPKEYLPNEKPKEKDPKKDPNSSPEDDTTKISSR